MRAPHLIPLQGSKRMLAPSILQYVPRCATLLDPFGGSGAFTIAAAVAGKADAFLLADTLPELVGLWLQVRDRPSELAELYRTIWERGRTDPAGVYLAEREAFNAQRGGVASDPLRSARLLYLLARCVKNAIRFNRVGQFNQAADRRRLGTRPDVVARNAVAISALLRGRLRLAVADYQDLVLGNATPDDVVYFDPPYQGVSLGHNRRYASQLDVGRFVHTLATCNARGLRFLVSFDGRTGAVEHGPPLPEQLGLQRLELRAGKSAQATLNGEEAETVESLYLSPALVRSL